MWTLLIKHNACSTWFFIFWSWMCWTHRLLNSYWFFLNILFQKKWASIHGKYLDNIQEFYVLKCPECNFIHQEESSFQEHAVKNQLNFLAKKQRLAHFKSQQVKKSKKYLLLIIKGVVLNLTQEKTQKLMTATKKMNQMMTWLQLRRKFLVQELTKK